MLAIKMKIFSGLVILLLVSACQSTSKPIKKIDVQSMHQERVALYGLVATIAPKNYQLLEHR